MTREGLLIGAYVLLAIGSALVLWGSFTDWTPDPEQPIDYPKEGKRWR